MITNIKINIFNSLKDKKEELVTLKKDELKMYVCGPTVYERPHLGNARSMVFYDLIYRFFKLNFKNVTYVRNITDIDDKIIVSAKEKNISINKLTTKIINELNEDLIKLKTLKPTFEPKATENVAEMIQIIDSLIKNGNAYISDNHVLFSVDSYSKYGELSNKKIEDLIAGARIEKADYKKNPLDFVLWKPKEEGDEDSACFESPWGVGRPGWHIECSAMSTKYLGTDFDIHGGGSDLRFPHHENEIAQSRCANLNSNYAKYWIHNGFLTVNGEKMSKSLKNFFTIDELLNKGLSGNVIRHILLSTHYRKPLDFNEKLVTDSKIFIHKIEEILDKIDLEKIKTYIAEYNKIESGEIEVDIKNCNENWRDCLISMAEDFNTSKVYAILNKLIKILKNNIEDENLVKDFIFIVNLFGFFSLECKIKDEDNEKPITDDEFINKKIEERNIAKLNKNWSEADKIRDDLLKEGIILEDSKEGTKWKINN